MTKLEPRCFPERFKGQKETSDAMNTMGIAYTSTGYLMPCCWLDDDIRHIKEYENLGLHDEELKLANNKSVEDIVYSEQWQNFTRILAEEPHNAPTKCKQKCGT